MKWFFFSHKKLSSKKSRKSTTNSSLNVSQPWILKAILLPIVGSLILSGDVPKWQPRNLASFSSELNAESINKVAEMITVKVYGREFLGSGIILKRQNREYLVLTNQHVLRAGKQPFTIKTFDGKTHESKVLFSQTPSQDDLALLSFKSDRDEYLIATTSDRNILQEGELVYAAGFPGDVEEGLIRSQSQSGFAFTTGSVTAILEKPLQQGYQIAYTNLVQKGMSGGPVLNQRGEVVGINGRHAYPLWEAPDLYEDNSQPCQLLQDLIIRSSLAIPVEKALAFAMKSDLTNDVLDRDLVNLPQDEHFFSTIVEPNSYNSATEIKTSEISSKHCQQKPKK